MSALLLVLFCVLNAVCATVSPIEMINQSTVPTFQRFLSDLQKHSIILAHQQGPVKAEDFGLKPAQLDKILHDDQGISALPAFNDLAQSYMIMDKADAAKIEQLGKLCAAGDGGLLDPKSQLCQDTPEILLKVIEARINLVSFYILNSEKLLQVPLGWIEHVEHLKGALETNKIPLTNTLSFVVTLLRHHAKLPEVIEAVKSENPLVPKTGIQNVNNPNATQHDYKAASAPSASVADQAHRTKITVDARHLTASRDPMDGFVAQAIGNMMNM